MAEKSVKKTTKSVKTTAENVKKPAESVKKTVPNGQNTAQNTKTTAESVKKNTQSGTRTAPKSEKKTADAWKSAGGDVKNTLKILVAVCDSATASHASIKSALRFCPDLKFADELRTFAERFEQFCCSARQMAERYDREIEDKGRALQFLQRLGADIKMLTDPDTNSVAAKIILDTTRNMIEIGSLLRHTGNITHDAEELACGLLVFHEGLINDMKNYL